MVQNNVTRVVSGGMSWDMVGKVMGNVCLLGKMGVFWGLWPAKEKNPCPGEDFPFLGPKAP